MGLSKMTLGSVGRIICADWGKKPKKRAAYEVLVPERVVRRVAAEVQEVEPLLSYAAQGPLSTLVAFDAPIGVPESFIAAVPRTASRSNSGFLDWLFRASLDECKNANEWSPLAPFFQVPKEGGEGSLRAFEDAARQKGVDLYRRIEKQTGGKTVFLTGGIPGSVGCAARDIWRGIVATRKQGTPFCVWPFEGSADALLAVDGPVIAEIYPRAAYATALVDSAPRARMSVAKSDKKKLPKELRGRIRRLAVDRLLETRWSRTNGVRFEDTDHARANEDDFDALVTGAALLRCVVEKLPIHASDFYDPATEGAILGTGSVDLSLSEIKFT
jgi:hypothetical protein